MNVLVVGANGQIGRHLVELLNESPDHTPIAFVRKEDQVNHFKGQGIEARLNNLENSVQEISQAMEDIDSVVFTAGSGGSTGADKTLLIDLDGAVKVMEAAKLKGIKRFVLVSALGADDRSKWNEEIKSYYVAKHFADQWLTSSDLNYTIVRPGILKNEDSRKTVQIAPSIERTDDYSIPRVDVARVILVSLDKEETYRQAFDLISGDQDISEALETL